MKQILIKIAKCLTLVLSWLTISPLFVFFARKWEMIGKKVRILLLLLSPLMLIIYLITSLLCMQLYSDYHRKYRFADEQVIERITGIPFPKLDIVEYQKGRTSFQGDYSDRIVLSMEEDLDESTYQLLDSMLHKEDTNWNKSGDEYSYNIMWGNGLPTPEGEDEEEDTAFSLSFTKGSKQIHIVYGSW